MAAIKQRGVTLIEMVIVIVILGIAASSVLTSLGAMSRSSVDPMLKQQMLTIAKSYFDEMNSYRFPAVMPCVAPLPIPDRAEFSELCDFNTISNETPWDLVAEAANSNLSGYMVQVTIESGVTLGDGTNNLTNSNAVILMRVTVTGPDGQSLVLQRFRTDW